MARLNMEELRPDLSGLPALAAEALGTGVLVLATAGAGSAFGAIGGSVGGAQVALAPGLTFFVLALLFLPVSGAHFNPAVTLGLVLSGRLPRRKLIPYAVAQLAGALAAGLVLRVLLRSTVLGISTTQMPGLAALLLEALLTFWLVWVYLALGDDKQSQAVTAAALGATVAAAILWAGPLSGACMNPARSLGPALAALDFSDLWIYLIGPFLGAAAAANAYKAFRALR
jgi:MIP family channel proteins